MQEKFWNPINNLIDYLRKILIKELEGREEGYTDGNRLLKGHPVSTLKHIR